MNTQSTEDTEGKPLEIEIQTDETETEEEDGLGAFLENLVDTWLYYEI